MTPEGCTDTFSSSSDDPDLTVCVLASGSKGNSIYVSDGHTSLLFDAGLSGIEIERRLNSRNLSPDQLNAIIVSHEHEDHIRSVGVLARRYNLPVYMSSKAQLSASSRIGALGQVIPLQCGCAQCINSFTIHPFYVSHDAEDPMGFTIQKNNFKIGIATDLGIVTTMVKEHLKGCQVLILEANHDSDMLANGPYPWHLKQRIRSRSGHLSNEDAGRLLKEIKHPDLQYVILAHLSEQNNTPEKALREAGQSLASSSANLMVSTQAVCGRLIHLHS
ncbi:MAG: MBL fold metallo-hydrolase [Desulfobacterales bacterium]|nr:MBL fold metallo-hydrolase [Desulfobacterales bacterium]MDD4071452.1 MBL fold metallo-hydrolase [Desulfobacterales bacterium]MDD4393216.1 MBL fold metallo-hydrolase [Desulfobacterales bacterium]